MTLCSRCRGRCWREGAKCVPAYHPIETRILPSLPTYLRWVRDLRDESRLELVLNAIEKMQGGRP